MADVSVRPARPLDAERVARVQLETWRQAYDGLLPPEVLDTPLEQVAAVWLNAIEVPPSPAHRVLVAMERDELVGFASSAPDPELGEGTVEVTALLVEPRWGRRGRRTTSAGRSRRPPPNGPAGPPARPPSGPRRS